MIISKPLIISALAASFLFFSCGSTDKAAQASSSSPARLADDIADKLNETSPKEAAAVAKETAAKETAANETAANETAANEAAANETATNEVAAEKHTPKKEESQAKENKDDENLKTKNTSPLSTGYDRTFTDSKNKDKQEDVKNKAEDSKASSPNKKDNLEKVDKADSNIKAKMDKAPTRDEKNKVPEVKIQEEKEPEQKSASNTKSRAKNTGNKSSKPLPTITAGPYSQTQAYIAPESSKNTKTSVSRKTPARRTTKANNTSQSQKNDSQTKTEAQNQKNDSQAKTAAQNQKNVSQAKTAAQNQKNPPVAANAENDAKSEEKPEQKEEKKEVTPPPVSRKVSLKINQYLDVDYPGKGWTYIGESQKSKLLSYNTRRMFQNNTIFTLKAKKAGTTILHFYKEDRLKDEYIDDYLEVTVENTKKQGRVRAPLYGQLIPAKPARREERKNAQENPSLSAEKSALSETPKPESSGKIADKANSADNNKNSSAQDLNQNRVSNANKGNNANNDGNVRPQSMISPELPKYNAPQVSGSQNSNENEVKTVVQNTDTKETSPQSNEITQENQDIKSILPPISSESSGEESPYMRSEPEVISESQGIEVDESLLEQAKKDYAEKKYSDALEKAQLYLNNASSRIDEALFLLGQIWESDSSVRDIRSSVDSYDTLLKRHPTSQLWKDAKERSIYLKRFYIDIR